MPFPLTCWMFRSNHLTKSYDWINLESTIGDDLHRSAHNPLSGAFVWRLKRRRGFNDRGQYFLHARCVESARGLAGLSHMKGTWSVASLRSILRDARFRRAPQDEVVFRGEILDPHGEERRLRRVSNHEGRSVSPRQSAICDSPERPEDARRLLNQDGWTIFLMTTRGPHAYAVWHLFDPDRKIAAHRRQDDLICWYCKAT